MLSDPDFAAREAIIRMVHPDFGEIPMQNTFPRLSETPGHEATLGPDLGQHNKEIYTRLLHLSADKVTATAAELSVGLLAESVKRVALVAERNTPVRLSFSAGQLMLEAGTGDEAQAEEVIEAEFSDGNPEFRYLRCHASRAGARARPPRRPIAQPAPRPAASSRPHRSARRRAR